MRTVFQLALFTCSLSFRSAARRPSDAFGSLAIAQAVAASPAASSWPSRLTQILPVNVNRALQFLLTCVLCLSCSEQMLAVFPQADLLQEEETVQPGRPFWVALRLQVEQGQHVYWKNPGEAGMPLRVDWKLPPGFRVDPLQWPVPEVFTVDGLHGFGYSGTVVLLARIAPPPQLSFGTPLILEANLEWLACSSTDCRPGSALLSLPLAVSSLVPKPNVEWEPLFREARALIPRASPDATALRQGDRIRLELPSDSIKLDPIWRADFFPEEPNFTDSRADLPIVSAGEGGDGYVVELTTQNRGGAAPAMLKGILVFYGQNEEKGGVEAFEIDSVLDGLPGQGVVSLLDSSESTSHFSDIQSIRSPSSPDSLFDGGVGMAVLFAFMGGILLNFMPCVLPVISLKVMGFVRTSGNQSRLSSFKHGGMFSLGVMISFWVLAGIILAFRSYGQTVGWGFQLQEPLFVVALASLLFIFALSLFGLFEWGLSFASWAGQTQSDAAHSSSGCAGSFLSGMLATAVATPCTGPFLGSAVGFAVTLPVFQAILIFTSLGFGMCLPYLLLALFPSWLRFLPKPGAWMETFKQLMGFFLLATVLWLLWIFSAQTNTLSLICVLGGFLCFSMGGWIYGRSRAFPEPNRTKRLFASVSVLVLVLSGLSVILWPRATWEEEPIAWESHLARGDVGQWEKFSPERLAQLRSEGTPVLVDFTAKWCLICQANHLVLEGMMDELNRMGVVKMKADWTKGDPVITEELRRFGRNSVPLYLLYGSGGGEPLILPQILTADTVVDYLERAVSLDF